MANAKPLTDLEKVSIEAFGDFIVVEESYGFSVRPGAMRRRRATLVEWTAQYMGFLAIFATIGMVMSSTGLSGAAFDIFEAVIFAGGLVIAILFFWLGTRGTAMELQVDTKERKLRSVVRNHRNKERELDVFAFREIQSAFVFKAGQNASKGRFTVRTNAEPRGVSLIEGNSKALTSLHIILSRMLKTPAKPSAEKAEKTGGLFAPRPKAAAAIAAQ